jgi:hypothetical protein
MPEVLAHANPHAGTEPRWHRPQHVAGGEEAAFVEQAVGREEQLPVDVPDRAVLDQRGRDEQSVIRRLLDERHDGRQPGRVAHERCQTGIVEPHGDLGREILEEVAGQPELGKDDEVRTIGARLGKHLAVTGQVLVQGPQSRRKLGKRDPDGLHGPEDTRPPCVDGGVAGPLMLGFRRIARGGDCLCARRHRRGRSVGVDRQRRRTHVNDTQEVVAEGRGPCRDNGDRLRGVRCPGGIAEPQRPCGDGRRRDTGHE